MKINKLITAMALTAIISGCASVTAETYEKVAGNADFSPVVKAVDTNNDGKMSREEWEAAGVPISSFNSFENGRGYVTQQDYDTNASPEGIDINGDGQLTVAEFIEFDKIISAKMGNKVETRPTISAAERALAMWEVQNTMSKHAYLHAAGLNSEEIDMIWVDAKGPNAKSATFASPGWVMNGIKTIKGAYGARNQENREKALTALSKVNPAVKDIPENLGAGHEWAMHTNTTPILEVAGDGKTAKGVWYSPGMGLMSNVANGEVEVKGTFFWEKYAGDFVLENGQWKIWHLQMAYDFTPSVDDKWLDFDKKGMVQQGEQASMGMPDGFTKPEFSYPGYSPARPSIIYPIFPEPYYTFSETFAY